MSAHYGIAFSLRADHAYYASGRADDLVFEPTAECLERLRYYRLLFKAAQTSAAVISERKNTATAAAPTLVPVVPVPDGTVFRFLVRVRDPRFLNVSDVDQAQLKPGRVIVLSTKGKSIFTSAGEKRLRVLTGALPAPIAVVPKTFVRGIDRALEPATVELIDDAGTGVFEQPMLLDVTDEPSPAPISVTVGHTDLGEGTYTLQFLDAVRTVVQSETVFVTGDATQRDLLAIVEVHQKASHMSVTPPPIVHLKFLPRKVRWIYDIEVRTTAPAGTALLDAAKLELIPSGTFSVNVDASVEPTSVVFTSNTTIALQEQPRTGISLKHRDAAGAEQVVVQNMPNPAAERLTRSGGQVESRMFLTLN